jgi:hypothetical protein
MNNEVQYFSGKILSTNIPDKELTRRGRYVVGRICYGSIEDFKERHSRYEAASNTHDILFEVRPIAKISYKPEVKEL